MDKLKQAQDILESNRAYLLAEKEEIIKRLQDSRITAWSKIKFSSLDNMFKALGISSADLQKTLKSYPVLGKELNKHIKACNIDISNQLADLIGCKSPDKALLAAEQIKPKLESLAELKLALYNEIEIFITADKVLRQSLNIEALIPLSSRLAQKHKHLFNEGVEVYQLITEPTASDNTTLSLDETNQEVKKLESRYKNIDILGLPRLAEEIIYHYIKIGTDTIKQVSLFAKATTGLLSSNIGVIHNIKNDLSTLKTAETQIIIREINKQAMAISNLIGNLYHKRELKTTLAKTTETLELLNIYHLAIKNKIIPAIKAQITDPGAEINPVVIAGKMTRSFFTGTKGIILSMKLMVKSLSGQEAINRVELQIILEKAITHCKVFYGKSPKDIKELRLFINDLIKQFSKPFPYDNIFMLVKQTIGAYGNNLENFIKQYETKKEFQAIAKTKIPGNFGKLAAALINKRDTFTKANK